MSISISNIVNLRQNTLKSVVLDEYQLDGSSAVDTTFGGLFGDNAFAWLTSGSRLEIVDTKTGSKVGAWTFGWVLKDLNTAVVCVEEIQRHKGRLPLLAVAVNCDFSGGMVCIFDFIRSKVIRAIQIREKITQLHVIDGGCDVLTLPGPLRNFDGVVAVGVEGGDVFLVDVCRQVCDEALTLAGLNEIKDELNPSQLCNITVKDLVKVEFHKEFAVRNSQHLAIHLNVVFNTLTKHFTLKGPKGEDRIHVNRAEVTVSALHYCPQLGSLLVGYNFGAFQLFNLMTLDLVYTSPVCDEHIPIIYFTVQEPADDPRAYCYIWATYSSQEEKPSCLPLAVMYALCYNTKEYHEGYGCLYQDFNTASIHFQMELGVPENFKRNVKPRGGCCLKLNSISKGPITREGPHHDSNEDNLTLCVIAWNVCYRNGEIDTFLSIFDMNQWYKEQMPSITNLHYSSTYIIQIQLNDLIDSVTSRSDVILDVSADKNSFQMFKQAQRLEEHFCPNSISFGMCCLRENDVIFMRNCGVQKALLNQIESAGPLCLVEPAKIYQEIVGLGLIPLFIDLPSNTPISTNQQREVILGTALENHLIGWLCKCASEWANGSFLSTGCSLDLLITWAFQRATTLKNHCDNSSIPLFDHSGTRLDNNTNILLNSCTRQLNNLCTLYGFILKNLFTFISNLDLIGEQYKCLQKIVVYFEVLQWLLNVGLLPECPIETYPRCGDFDRIYAPYPSNILVELYNHRRALLKIVNEEQFNSKSSALFIDNLLERECTGKHLQEQWRNDGGNGLYPPPSLQSLLRTYLIDDMNLFYRHTVVIYVFLDLAMTLDPDQYKPVITHLIKFPAVFKVSPSLIKITQAFWQLDHGDCNTAMGLLLDPLVSAKDLNNWHHKVALRSLLLQKQQNFALLYVQVRKPAFVDDDDILTAISLYVANNMLDEAFYFEKHFTNQKRREKFLLHLFGECTKNDTLRSVIYRTLTETEEMFFLKYLQDRKDSEAADLHVYYHILRSHYIEAFDSHQKSGTCVENLGLRGKDESITRDQLVAILKKLLPTVYKNLLAICRKEKQTMWQEVSRPTPLSVFIHNSNENVQYKSTLIEAALAKAKQTFNNSFNKSRKLETEDIPFLRTPKVAKNKRKQLAVMVNSYIEQNQSFDGDVTGSPNAKRLKLSLNDTRSFALEVSTKLETPIVKRKTAKRSPEVNRSNMTTPHSILKVKNLPDETSVRCKIFEDDFRAFEKVEYTPVTSLSKASVLGLSPRKSLVKTPSVRFEGLQSTSSNSAETSRNLSASLEAQHQQTSKNSSAEDEFFSPETSLDDMQLEEVAKEVEKQECSSPLRSPRSRKSNRRSFEAPTRSSPRLANEIQLKEVDNTSTSSPSDETHQYSPSIPKLRPRKSLCRKVLETNAINRVLNSSPETPRSRRSRVSDLEKKTEDSELLEIESTVKYNDGEEKRQSSIIRRHNLTTTFIESDLDSSQDVSLADISIGMKFSKSVVKFLDSSLGDESVEEEPTDLEAKKEERVSLTLSAFDSSTASFDVSSAKLNSKLSDSVLEFINNSSDERMEVDYDIVKDDKSREETSIEDSAVGKKVIKNKEVGEETLKNKETAENFFGENEVADENLKNKEVVEENPKNKEIAEQNFGENEVDDDNLKNKEVAEENQKKDESSDSRESSKNRSVDPEMNIFEISDDLTYNNLNVENEGAFEDEDLCYSQQHTLESVLEDNIPPFEKNVFIDESSESEHGEMQKSQENSVIEIGSSSEEEEKYQKQNDLSRGETEDEVDSEGSLERNIYDVEGVSSVSSQQTSDDELYKDTRYRSDIIYVEHNKPEGGDDKEESSSSEDFQNLNEGEKRVKLFDATTAEDKGDSSVVAEEEPARKFDQTRKSYGLFHGDIILQETEIETQEIDQVAEKIEDQKLETQEGESEGAADKSVCENKETAFLQKEKSIEGETSTEKMKTLEKTRKSYGLFHGDIIFEETELEVQENNQVAEKIKDQKEEIQEKESEGAEAKDTAFLPIQKSIEGETATEKMKTLEKTRKSYGLFHGDIILEQGEEETQETENIIVSARENFLRNEETTQHKLDSSEYEEVSKRISVEEKLVEDIVDGTQEVVAETDHPLGKLSKSPVFGEKPGEGEDTIDKTQKVEEDAVGEDGALDISEGMDDLVMFAAEEEPSTAEVPAPIPKEQPTITEDPLDTMAFAPLILPRKKQVDILDNIDFSVANQTLNVLDFTDEIRSRTRSASISSNRSVKISNQVEEMASPRRSLRRRESQIGKPDEESLQKTNKIRTRRASNEETTPSSASKTLSLRKRSASVDEVKLNDQKSDNEKKSRKVKATSGAQLPSIVEEDAESAGVKRATSLIESYTSTRRVTRKQMNLFKKTLEESGLEVESWDPIVLLDNSVFEGTPDPEEKKVYETSPSSSLKLPVRRGLRSASQVSEASQRSKSLTPEKAAKGKGRKKSTDEASIVSTRSRAHEEESLEPPQTRSRTNSVSSVRSDKSSVKGGPKSRTRRVQSGGILPEIKEEHAERVKGKEVSGGREGEENTKAGPKSRTRKTNKGGDAEGSSGRKRTRRNSENK